MASEKPDDVEHRSESERSRRRARAENAIQWADAPAQARGGKRAERSVQEPLVRSAVRGVAEGKVGEATRGAGTTVTQDGHNVPVVVRQHFVQVGPQYFFADGARAFTDRGVKLSTPSENTQVIRDLVAIAQSRGWQRVTVSGSERFRKEAWGAAREAGLTVKGYRASALDEARVVRRLARDRDAPASSAITDRQHTSLSQDARVPASGMPRQHRGRLIDHGVAAYQHDPHEPMSYFVKIETERGEKEIWGVDLERAFRESLSRPKMGDDIVLRAVKREPVTVKSRLSRSDEVDAPQEVAAHRNRWIVEKKEFLEAREKAAQVLRDPSVAPAKGSRDHPELLGAYLQVHAAELAAQQIRDPQDREKFVALVRSALADSVARGEALPAVRLRENEIDRRSEERSVRTIVQDRGEHNR